MFDLFYVKKTLCTCACVCQSGRTALMYADFAEKTEVVALLIELGADVDAVDNVRYGTLFPTRLVH